MDLFEVVYLGLIGCISSPWNLYVLLAHDNSLVIFLVKLNIPLLFEIFVRVFLGSAHAT